MTDTAAPARAAVDLIRAAKAGDVSAAVAVDLHCAGLDRDQLTSLLRLLFPFLAELYAAKGQAERWARALDDAAFAEVVESLGEMPDTLDDEG